MCSRRPCSRATAMSISSSMARSCTTGLQSSVALSCGSPAVTTGRIMERPVTSEGLREPTLIVGDFNVAPLEWDVWRPKALLDVVSHTPVEVDALTPLQQAHDWVDIG